MNKEISQFNFNGLIILEMANNHQGSVEHGKHIVRSFAPIIRGSGVRGVIKFQFRDIDTFIHPDFRDTTEYKHIPRFISTALSKKQFKEIVDTAREEGFLTMSSPADNRSVDMIIELGLDAIKVASCFAADWPLLEKIVSAGKPIVCSTGGLSIDEVDNLVSFFKHRDATFAIMHCVSLYPTPNYKMNLERVTVFKERYPDVPIGLSSHEEPNEVNIVRAAYAQGARLFERHVGVETDAIKLNAYSLRPDQFKGWLDAYHETETMVGSRSIALRSGGDEEREQLMLQKRGVYAKRNIKKGEKLLEGDVFFAMPLQGGQMESGEWKNVFIAKKEYKANAPLGKSETERDISRKEIIYRTIHDVKGILNTAKIFTGSDSSVSVFHPEGVKNFRDNGCVAVTCFDRPHTKRLIVLFPDQKYSRHYHTKVEITYQVNSGVLHLGLDGREKVLYPGDTIVIPRGAWHEILPSKGVVVEEISSPAKNDVIHFSDKQVENATEEKRATHLRYWGRHQFDNEPI